MMIKRTDLDLAGKTLAGHYAGFTSRLLAFVIDVIIISVTLIAINWFLSVTATMLQFRTILGFSFRSIPGFKSFVDALFGLPIGSTISFLFVMGYHVFFLVFAGQTPGKALMGLRVVPIKGGKLTWLQAFVRFLGYIPSAILVWLGFIWMLIDDRRQAWHDKLARTCVIYTWEALPDEKFLANEIQKLQK